MPAGPRQRPAWPLACVASASPQQRPGESDLHRAVDDRTFEIAFDDLGVEIYGLHVGYVTERLKAASQAVSRAPLILPSAWASWSERPPFASATAFATPSTNWR